MVTGTYLSIKYLKDEGLNLILKEESVILPYLDRQLVQSNFYVLHNCFPINTNLAFVTVSKLAHTKKD